MISAPLKPAVLSRDKLILAQSEHIQRLMHERAALIDAVLGYASCAADCSGGRGGDCSCGWKRCERELVALMYGPGDG